MKEKKYKIVRLLHDGTWKEVEQFDEKEKMKERIQELEKTFKRHHFAAWTEKLYFHFNG